jgi:hypothetical protein
MSVLFNQKEPFRLDGSFVFFVSANKFTGTENSTSEFIRRNPTCPALYPP